VEPTLEVLTLVMSGPIVKKEVPWIKLICTIDPLKEKAPRMALQKKIKKLLVPE
jgi:hypothetical protein